MKIQTYEIINFLSQNKDSLWLENHKEMGLLKLVDESPKRKINWGTYIEVPVGESFCINHPLFKEYIFCMSSYYPKQKTVSLLDVLLKKKTRELQT